MLQGALSSSSTLAQLRAFAKIRAKDVQNERDLDWEVLYLALRCGHLDEAIKVTPLSNGRTQFVTSYWLPYLPAKCL